MARKGVLRQLKPLVQSLAGSSRTQKVRSRRRGGRRGGVQTTKGSRPRTVNNPSWGRSLPAAYASHVRPRFNISSRTATTAVVSGCDLIYPIPATLNPDSETIFSIFPANPAYWAGTRIAQFAPAYQNYRPLAFTVSYIPQVAVTQAGTVFMGTLWNEAAPSDNIQQSLFTSNGGCLTQCYVPCDSVIKCGSNLQQNLFKTSGALGPNTCPFIFLAGVRGADVVPGYFYVTYTYEFKNPIGSAWEFNVRQQIQVSQASNLLTGANRTFVLLEGTNGYGPGTQFDVEGTGTFYYQGTEVTLAGTAVGQLYSNRQWSPITQGNLSITSINIAAPPPWNNQQVNLTGWVEGDGDTDPSAATVRWTPLTRVLSFRAASSGAPAAGTYYIELPTAATGISSVNTEFGSSVFARNTGPNFTIPEIFSVSNPGL